MLYYCYNSTCNILGMFFVDTQKKKDIYVITKCSLFFDGNSVRSIT